MTEEENTHDERDDDCFDGFLLHETFRGVEKPIISPVHLAKSEGSGRGIGSSLKQDSDYEVKFEACDYGQDIINFVFSWIG